MRSASFCRALDLVAVRDVGPATCSSPLRRRACCGGGANSSTSIGFLPDLIEPRRAPTTWRRTRRRALCGADPAKRLLRQLGRRAHVRLDFGAHYDEVDGGIACSILREQTPGRWRRSWRRRDPDPVRLPAASGVSTFSTRCRAAGTGTPMRSTTAICWSSKSGSSTGTAPTVAMVRVPVGTVRRRRCRRTARATCGRRWTPKGTPPSPKCGAATAPSWPRSADLFSFDGCMEIAYLRQRRHDPVPYAGPGADDVVRQLQVASSLPDGTQVLPWSAMLSLFQGETGRPWYVVSRPPPLDGRASCA